MGGLELLATHTLAMLASWISPPIENTAEAVREKLMVRMGTAVSKMERAGQLVIWPTLDGYNAAASDFNRIMGCAQGCYDGRVHLFADQIAPGDEFAVFVHEAGGHGSLPAMLGAKKHAQLVARARALVEAGDPAAMLADCRVPEDTPEEYAGEELVAYLAEVVVGRRAAGLDVSEALAAWFDDLVAAVVAWAVSVGIDDLMQSAGCTLELRPIDIAALAVLAIRWRARRLH